MSAISQEEKWEAEETFSIYKTCFTTENLNHVIILLFFKSMNYFNLA